MNSSLFPYYSNIPLLNMITLAGLGAALCVFQFLTVCYYPPNLERLDAEFMTCEGRLVISEGGWAPQHSRSKTMAGISGLGKWEVGEGVMDAEALGS